MQTTGFTEFRYPKYWPSLALAVLLASAVTSTPSRSASPDLHEILISSFMFQPMELTIKAGASVTWTNLDEEAHSVVSDAGVFRSGALDTNEHFVYQFATPGVYHFTCSLHPRMVGTIIVD